MSQKLRLVPREKETLPILAFTKALSISLAHQRETSDLFLANRRNYSNGPGSFHYDY